MWPLRGQPGLGKVGSQFLRVPVLVVPKLVPMVKVPASHRHKAVWCRPVSSKWMAAWMLGSMVHCKVNMGMSMETCMGMAGMHGHTKTTWCAVQKRTSGRVVAVA